MLSEQIENNDSRLLNCVKYYIYIINNRKIQGIIYKYYIIVILIIISIIAYKIITFFLTLKVRARNFKIPRHITSSSLKKYTYLIL